MTAPAEETFAVSVTSALSSIPSSLVLSLELIRPATVWVASGYIELIVRSPELFVIVTLSPCLSVTFSNVFPELLPISISLSSYVVCPVPPLLVEIVSAFHVPSVTVPTDDIVVLPVQDEMAVFSTFPRPTSVLFNVTTPVFPLTLNTVSVGVAKRV